MLDELKTFVAVVRAGSFSRAAAQNGEAVSSVTRRISRLETELDVELFIRSTHTLRPTADAHRLFAYAEKLLAGEAELRSAMRTPVLSSPVPLKISAFQSFGEHIVIPAIQAFLLRNTQVKIDVALDNRVVDLHREGVDLAIRIGKPKDASLKIRKLLRHEMVLCASAEYLRHHGTPEQPRQLVEHNCLCFQRGKRKNVWHFHRGETHHKVTVAGNLRSVGGKPLIEAARAGLGITLMSRWLLHDDIKNGRLIELLPQYRPALRASGGEQVYALYPAERSHPARAAVLEEIERRCATVL